MRPEADDARALRALAATGAGVWEWDLASGRVVWDRRMREIYGFAADDTGADDFDGTADAALSRRHPDDAGALSATLVRATAAGGPFHEGYRIVLPSGEIRWLETRGTVIRDDAERPATAVGITWDVSGIRAMSTQVAALVSGMPIGFESFDTDWNFSAINAEGARLIGRSPDQVIGRNVWEEFPATVGSNFERVFRRVARTHVTETLEEFYPEPLNAWYELRVTGDDYGIAVYFLDVTDRHTARERVAAAEQTQREAAELARSHAQLSAFAGQVAHDLRTPLTAITGFAELATEGASGADTPDPEVAAQSLARIAASARRMRLTLDRLLEYASVGGTLDVRTQSLDSLVRPVLQDLAEGADDADITWNDSPITGDPVQLRCLLQNLVVNALRYRDPTRQAVITVRGEARGIWTELSVADNGLGIPADRRATALAPLSRLHHGVAGSGLGLAICARIAAAHGGSLRLGDTPGGGTTITVVLPSTRTRSTT